MLAKHLTTDKYDSIIQLKLKQEQEKGKRKVEGHKNPVIAKSPRKR
jgi:hypothetical protein